MTLKDAVLSLFSLFKDVLQHFLATKTITVIGDSHAMVFNHYSMFARMPGWKFNVTSVPGATASGLKNPNSQTNAAEIFQESIRISTDDYIAFILGEVDTGFVIWYRAQKYGETVDDMLEQSINNYLELIKNASQEHKVIVISSPLPTIPDGNAIGEVANLRKSVTISQKERTLLALSFNTSLKREVSKIRGTIFIDMDKVSLDRHGNLKSSLINKHAADHHYNKTKYSKLLSNQLRKHVS